MELAGKYIASLLSCILIFFCCTGQVTVKSAIDKDKIIIGEPITLTLEAYVPLGESVKWFPTDTIEHFDFINKGKIDTIESLEGKKYAQVFSITSFDSGRWQILPFVLEIGDRSFYTDSIPVDVLYSASDPNEDYRDIKDIEEIVNPDTGFIPWIIAGVTLIALVLLVYFLRKRKLEVIPKTVVPALSAFDEAMKSLAELRKAGLPQNGQTKIYYTQLNDILRVFVLRKLNISTWEKTNEELILQLKDLNLPKESFIQLAQALRMSDFVKFARYQPVAVDNEKNFDIIESSIRSLNNIPQSGI